MILRPPLGQYRGFTLLELLAVIGIIATLTAFTIPAIQGFSKSPAPNQALRQVTGALERAREYAIANNTYTWVAFYQGRNAMGINALYSAILVSKDGTDPTEAFTVTGAMATNRYFLLDKVEQSPGVILKAAGANTWSGLLAPTTPPSDIADSLVIFSIRAPNATGAVDFKKVIQFSPSGNAHISQGIVSQIELGISPISAADIEDSKNISVIRIAGMTGQTMLYRP